jgi:3-carboxy-cis,cis-muconate cycloisomerase
MVNDPSSGLLSGLFSTAEMDAILSDAALAQEMLRFEWALGEATERLGLTAAGAAQQLKRLLDSTFLTAERAAGIRAGVTDAGNLVIPFLAELRRAVSTEAAQLVHYGATSQDVMDTATVLQTRRAGAAIEAGILRLVDLCVALARQHRGTVMAGRTWLQQGPPVTAGLKFAGYADMLARCLERLRQSVTVACVLQFGGAVGNLSALQGNGLKAAALMASSLELELPTLPWHTHRDRLASVAAELGILVAALGKMARDIALAMQTEVGEMLEGARPGRGASSTMPHKRNPVACARVLSVAVETPALVASMLSAMVQEHERGLGGWQAEWNVLPKLFKLASAAIEAAADAVDGLDVRGDAMAKNLQAAQGLNMAEAAAIALSPHLGHAAAHKLMQEITRDASRRGVSLRNAMEEAAKNEPALRQLDLDTVLDPARYLGISDELIDRCLERLQQMKRPRS